MAILLARLQQVPRLTFLPPVATGTLRSKSLARDRTMRIVEWPNREMHTETTRPIDGATAKSQVIFAARSTIDSAGQRNDESGVPWGRSASCDSAGSKEWRKHDGRDYGKTTSSNIACQRRFSEAGTSIADGESKLHVAPQELFRNQSRVADRRGGER